MEKMIQAKASDLENVVKEERLELEKKSGIESSIQEQDIKQYLMEVLQEVDKSQNPRAGLPNEDQRDLKYKDEVIMDKERID